MNNRLKSVIVLNFGTQGDFAAAANTRETKVSRVIRERDNLSDVEQQRWADLLGTDRAEIFGEEASHGETKA